MLPFLSSIAPLQLLLLFGSDYRVGEFPLFLWSVAAEGSTASTNKVFHSSKRIEVSANNIIRNTDLVEI